jgi:hypothetical protein
MRVQHFTGDSVVNEEVNVKHFLVLVGIYSATSCQANILTRPEGVSVDNPKPAISAARNIDADVYGAVINAFFHESEKLLIRSESTFGRVSPDGSEAKVISVLEESVNTSTPADLIDNYRKANEGVNSFV